MENQRGMVEVDVLYPGRLGSYRPSTHSLGWEGEKSTTKVVTSRSRGVTETTFSIFLWGSGWGVGLSMWNPDPVSITWVSLKESLGLCCSSYKMKISLMSIEVAGYFKDQSSSLYEFCWGKIWHIDLFKKNKKKPKVVEWRKTLNT